MTGEFSHMFSRLSQKMKASEIRELLKLLEKEEIISFAGGLPNPAAFPIKEIKEICLDLIENKGPQVLQYGTTEGVSELRHELAKRMQKKGMDIDYRNVLVTQGSQQALDLIGKVFVDPDDIIIVGAPTYLGADNAFKSYGAVLESVPLDDDGMPPELLNEKIHQLKTHGKHPDLIYLVPSFHNPAGVTIPESRREEIMRIAVDNDLVLVEDSPYSELRYSGEQVRPFKAMDPDGRVIYLGTFSKILAPGFRIAWCIAEGEILHKLIIMKQAADLCTNPFGQHVAAEYLSRGYIDTHVEKIKALYKDKRDKMVEALEKYFPKEVKWTKPDGGMFIWATLPQGIDTREMFPRAVQNNVAYVIGSAFYSDGRVSSSMRLNYTFATDEQIDIGIKRLAETIKEEMEMKLKEPKKAFEVDKDGLVIGV
ncbi:MAG: aminotransferase [Candidatus Proteinoplasmatales archaeon SG8-5]|nr:MAG: aminotransferase [Candidatus Proteinoplasmatales archaeon SG8-5]